MAKATNPPGTPRKRDLTMVQTGIRLSKALHRRLRVAAIERDQTVTEVITAALEKHLPAEVEA